MIARLKLILALTLLTFSMLSSASAFAQSPASQFKKAQYTKMKALIAKIKADDGTNAVTLKKEANDFIANHDKLNKSKYKNNAYIRTQDLKQATYTLDGKVKNLTAKKTSVVHQLKMTKEDAFNLAKVKEAFARMPKKDLYRLDASKVSKPRIKGQKSTFKELNVKKVEAAWFKGSINTRVPKSKTPPTGEVVLLWEAAPRNGNWRVVTAGGEVYVMKSMNQTQRGVAGGTWNFVSGAVVSETQAKLLADNGTLDQKSYKKLKKSVDAMWTCRNKVMKGFNKKAAKIRNKNADAKIRNGKLDANRKAGLDKLDSKCGKKKTAYEKQLQATADTLTKVRIEAARNTAGPHTGITK